MCLAIVVVMVTVLTRQTVVSIDITDVMNVKHRITIGIILRFFFSPIPYVKLRHFDLDLGIRACSLYLFYFFFFLLLGSLKMLALVWQCTQVHLLIRVL